MAVKLEVRWAPRRSLILRAYMTTSPGSPHHLPSTPDAWASSRCPTPTFRLVNAGPRTGKKHMRSLSSMNPDSRRALGCSMTSFLECSLTVLKPGSGWARRLPYHKTWGLEPLPQFRRPREKTTQDACYSALSESLSGLHMTLGIKIIRFPNQLLQKQHLGLFASEKTKAVSSLRQAWVCSFTVPEPRTH